MHGITSAQQGLTSRQPIGAYLNGVFPSSSPGSGGGVVPVDAFPGVTFSDPIKMVPQPGTSLLWVISRQGRVWRLDKNSPGSTKTLMLDVSANTMAAGDSGMLGIALHPEFGQAGSANRGYVYLWYNFFPSNVDGNKNYNRLSRFTLADGAASILPSSESVLINQYDEHDWHNGGDMFFGSDSFLHITVGDEGGLSDSHNNTQKIDGGLFSGVLRIDVNRDPSRSHAIRRQPQAGGTPPNGWPATYSQNYFIPNDNPWLDAGGSVLEEFYAIGLRSPHRMTFDTVTGKALLGDVGEGDVEEVNVLAMGANYQWAFREGNIAGPKARPTSVIGTETPPIHAYSHNGGRSCVIGGYVYRGSQLPASMLGKYIFGDYTNGKIWSLDWQTPGAQPVLLTQIAADLLCGFSVDAGNEIYFCTLGSSGRIYKLSMSGGTSQPPATLSATGAFSSLASLTPATGIIPYDVNSPLWSDGAAKMRWIALPNDGAPYSGNEIINFAATGEWAFPVGTVLIKHFEIGTNDANQAIKRRLETRFLTRATDGWYGVTYKWRADGSDADLLSGTENLDVTITTTSGGTRTQTWTFPGRGDCITCHTSNAGSVLGVKTRQLNGSFTYPATGITANQLATWSAIGMFDTPVSDTQVASFTKTVAITNTTASLEMRVRSYIDANCSHCHRPGGVRANMDARFDTPLDQQSIINGPLFNELGISGAKEVVVQDSSKSMMHIRMASTAAIKMPPLGKNVVDSTAVSVVAQWIASLGTANQPPVLAQPADQVTTRGTSAQIQLAASDPNGDALTYSAIGLPSGLSVNATSGLISGTVSTSAVATNSVTVTASDGTLSNSKSFLWTTTEGSSQPALVGGDVGTVGVAGSTVLASGVYTVKGAGTDIYGTSDGFHFAYAAISGDGEIKARVTSQTNTASWAKAGVMVREALSVGSRHGTMYVTPYETLNGFEMLKRTTTNGSTTDIGGPANNPPPNNWVRLMRTGNTITGYASANGTTWTQVHAASYTSLPATLYFGLCVTSVNNSLLGAATFDNVQITGGIQPPPTAPAAPTGLAATALSSASVALAWTDAANNETGYRIERATGTGAYAIVATIAADSVSYTDSGLTASTLYNYKVAATNTAGAGTAGPMSATTLAASGGGGTTLAGADIGSVGVAGSTVLTGGVYTMKGSGSDIYGTADSFHFAQTTMTGDGEIKARVTSQTNTASWAKAGVMIRETLANGSRHATTYITPYETLNGFEMLKRTTTNGSTTDIGGPANNAPPNNWVRLVRTGNTITGYASANGTTWTQIHAATYTSLPSSLYFGLVVTSVNNSVLGTATFDNVQIISGSAPPTVPAAPTGLAASAQSSSSIRLTWTDVATNETGYRVERATGAGAYAIVATLPADSVSHTDSSLSSSTLYNYKVSAYNTTGAGTAGPASATTLAAGGGSTTLVAGDIGTVGVAGSTTLSGGVYTVRGSGADIYYTADSFHFASTTITGDGEIKARVTSQTNTASWAKAGVMMRESTATGSRHATMYITPYETRNGFEYLSRSTTNGSTTDVGGPANNAPPNNWVRLVRAGNTITGYASANGTTWTQVNSVTFTSLPADLLVGLCVTSVNNSVLGTATFDNVQITGTSSAVLAPQAAITSFATWTSDSGLTGTSLDAAATPANDGVCNLLKFAFNMDPAVPNVSALTSGTGTSGLPSFSITKAGANSFFHVEFIRRSDNQLVYRPKKSTDLKTWENFTSIPTVTPIDANWERVVHDEPFDGTVIGNMFGTVEITQPDL